MSLRNISPNRSDRTRRRYPSLPWWQSPRWALARWWDFIWWIWTSVIIGGLIIGVIVSYIASGTPGVARPDNWPTVHVILTHPVIAAIGLLLAATVTVLSFLARNSERAELLG